MANFVKISKSKNLRYQLVSILYLLFITLTLLQVPSDWLRVNDKISKDFTTVTSDNDITDVELVTAIAQIEKLQSEFEDLRKKESDATGDKLTDYFFLNEKKGNQLFTILFELKTFYYRLPEDDARRVRFAELFKDDLFHGLADGNFNVWVQWKFKNVPGNLSLTLLNEVLVRCHLIHGSLDVTKKGVDELVKVAFNLDKLHLGDTALLVVNSGVVGDVQLLYGNKKSKDLFSKGDSVFFVPKSVGDYKISVKAKNGVEDFIEVKVSPMKISASGTSGKSGKQPIHYFFQGKPSYIVSSAIQPGSRFTIEGGKWSSVKISSGKMEFTPLQTGWNLLKLRSEKGSLYLSDSVFVYPTPRPVIVANQASDNMVTSKQLMTEGMLKILAFHPLHKDIRYKIESMDVGIIGEGVNKIKVKSDVIRLDKSQSAKVKFIQIKNIRLSTVSGEIQLEEPLLIEVI